MYKENIYVIKFCSSTLLSFYFSTPHYLYFHFYTVSSYLISGITVFVELLLLNSILNKLFKWKISIIHTFIINQK